MKSMSSETREGPGKGGVYDRRKTGRKRSAIGRLLGTRRDPYTLSEKGFPKCKMPESGRVGTSHG